MHFSERRSDSRKRVRLPGCAALAVVVAMITGLCSAQEAKEHAAPAGKPTPQQLRERLAGNLRGSSKMGPGINNPLASNSSVIATLRGQKQAADAEINQLRVAAAALLAGGGPARTSDANIGRQANPSPLVGKPAVAGGKPAPGSPSGAAASQCLQPHIDTVSGQGSGVLFSPVPDFNLYTIKGCGFSGKPGNIYLEGPFAAKRIQLLFPSPKDWSDTFIIAMLDPQLAGESDHDNVTLVIEPPGGTPMKKPGFRFYAARETVLLQTIPRAVVQFSGPPPFNSGQPVPAGDLPAVNDGFYSGYFTPFTHLAWQSPQTPPATLQVVRVLLISEGNFQGLAPASDFFDFGGLAPGFHPDSMRLDHVLDGSHSCPKLGDWNAGWDGNNIRVSWGVWRCGLEDLAVADIAIYQLSVWVTGPRGVDPWSTALGVKPFHPH